MGQQLFYGMEARISPNANAYGSETVPMPLLYWHGFDTIRNTKNAIKEVPPRILPRRRAGEIRKMSAKETFGHEMSALREARKATWIDDCTVVTWDDERTTEDGIRIVPA